MTTGPRDPMAAGAAGRGHMRASDADREQVLDILKAAFVQGRLIKDELDIRAGQTLASRTYAELAAVTADIPVAPIEPPPLRPVRTDARKQFERTRFGFQAILRGAHSPSRARLRQRGFRQAHQ